MIIPNEEPPASSAGLLLSKAIVSVGPPLSASATSPGSATPTWLPLVPSVIPSTGPVPTRLLALTAATVPKMSLRFDVPTPIAFSATIVLYSVVVPLATSRPPPDPPTDTRLSAIVTLIVVRVPRLSTPPPSSAVLPAMVTLVSVRLAAR